jgi:hypothetical protein
LTERARRATIARTMDASARRVYRERARRRLPPRLRRRRIGVRIAGLLGTAALAAVAVAIAVMVMPDHSSPGAAARTTVPPKPKAKPKQHRARHHRTGPTRAQLKQRRAAVAELHGQGYQPLKLSDYDFKTNLRVLIGRRADGAEWAFFFVRTHYIGHDAITPSARLRLASDTKRSATLAYTTYGPSDAACCPRGPRVTVRFVWDGTSLAPQQPIPSSFTRLHTAG